MQFFNTFGRMEQYEEIIKSSEEIAHAFENKHNYDKASEAYVKGYEEALKLDKGKNSYSLLLHAAACKLKKAHDQLLSNDKDAYASFFHAASMIREAERKRIDSQSPFFSLFRKNTSINRIRFYDADLAEAVGNIAKDVQDYSELINVVADEDSNKIYEICRLRRYSTNMNMISGFEMLKRFKNHFVERMNTLIGERVKNGESIDSAYESIRRHYDAIAKSKTDMELHKKGFIYMAMAEVTDSLSRIGKRNTMLTNQNNYWRKTSCIMEELMERSIASKDYAAATIYGKHAIFAYLRQGMFKKSFDVAEEVKRIGESIR